MKVLLVDDDERFLTAVAALLETVDGADVVGVAGDGDDAVAVAEQLAPDVIVMDLDMPRVDGIAATRRLRTKLPHAHVVILSGSDVIAHSADAHAAGAVAYVRKSNTVTDLPAVLESLRRERSA